MNPNTTNTAILKIDHAQPHFQLKTTSYIFYNALVQDGNGRDFLIRGARFHECRFVECLILLKVEASDLNSSDDL